MKEYANNKSARAFFPLMIVPGIVLLLAPATVDAVMKYFNFRESLGGLLQVSYFVGGVVGILLITRLMQRLSVKWLLLSQVIVLSISLLATASSPWYPLILLFFTIAGFANGILITFPGVYVTRVYAGESHHAQSMLYSFFSLGVVAGPILAGFIIDRFDSWRWAFAVPALLVLPLSIPVAVVGFERLENVKTLSGRALRKILDHNKNLFLGLLLAILLYIAAESAVSMWLVTFLEEEHGMSAGPAHWVLTGLWAGLTVGRWVFSLLSRKISPFRILVFITSVSGLLVLVAPLIDSRAGVIVMYPLVGVFYSAIYPFLISYSAEFPPDYSSAVFTIFLAAGAAGGAVLPYSVGLVNQFSGIVAGMSSISISIFGVLACLYCLRPHISDKALRTLRARDP